MDGDRRPGAAMHPHAGQYLLYYSDLEERVDFPRTDTGLMAMMAHLNGRQPTALLCVGSVSDDEMDAIWAQCEGYGCSLEDNGVLIMLLGLAECLGAPGHLCPLQLLAMGASGFYVH